MVALTVEPGAYFVVGGNMYYVLEADRNMFACENCKTGSITRLTSLELSRASWYRPAPSLVVPDKIPDE